MLLEQSLFLSLDLVLFPLGILDLFGVHILLSFLLKPVGVESLQPQSFNLSLVLQFLHSSFLLGQLFKLVLPTEFLSHISPELNFHLLLIDPLPDLSLFCLLFSLHHLHSVPFSLVLLILFFSSDQGLKLLLVQFSPQNLELLCISSPLFLFYFQFYEYFVLGLFLFVSLFFDGFFSGVELLDVRHILGLLLPDKFDLSLFLILLEFEGGLHVFESFLLFLFLDFHFPELAVDEGLHHNLDLVFLLEVLLIGFFFLFCLLVHLVF